MMALLRTLGFLFTIVSTAEVHGSLVIPPVRNAVDRALPQWKGGYPTVPNFPGTGRWGPPNETIALANTNLVEHSAGHGLRSLCRTYLRC